MSQLVNSIPGFQLTNLRFFKERFVETIPAATNLQSHLVAKTSKHFQKFSKQTGSHPNVNNHLASTNLTLLGVY